MTAFWASRRGADAIFMDGICEILRYRRGVVKKSPSVSLGTPKVRRKEK